MQGCGVHDPAQPAVCSTCAREVARRRATLRGVAVLGPIVVIIVGGGAYLMTRPKTVIPVPPTIDTVEGLQRERLAKTPCDPETSMALVDRLIELHRWREAADFAKASITKCGVIDRMQWRLSYVDQQLHDYADAERITTELIVASPSDSDFWWWRGEDFSYHAQPEAALADFRQSLALSYGAQSAQFAANRFDIPARAVHAMCEADRAWRYYVRALDGIPSQDMRDETAANARAGTCAAELGTGRATLPAHPTVTMSVGDATAKATLDINPRLGTTLISREFAAKAGFVVEEGERAQTASHDKIYSGTPAKVTLRSGGIAANNVDVLITDDLPGDSAGILGLSFLWHFSFADGADGTFILSPPSAKPL